MDVTNFILTQNLCFTMFNRLLLLFISFSLYGSNWEKPNLIWNYGMAQSCDKGLHPDPRYYFQFEPYFSRSLYKGATENQLLWLHTDKVSEFYHYILPRISSRVTLIISGSDRSFPSECLKTDEIETLLNHKNIIHVFAQNCDLISPKITPIPIGIDFHTCFYKGQNGGWGLKASPLDQEKIITHILKDSKPTNERKCRAFVDFQHSNSMRGSFSRYKQFGEDRLSIFSVINESGLIDYAHKMPRKDLWKIKSEYAFSISPHGNGLDCHRTWEDLALGCIVIVKTSPLDPLYEGLPVIIIKDWNEITEDNFKKWLNQYGDVSKNKSFRLKLTHEYWMNKVYEKTSHS